MKKRIHKATWTLHSFHYIDNKHYRDESTKTIHTTTLGSGENFSVAWTNKVQKISLGKCQDMFTENGAEESYVQEKLYSAVKLERQKLTAEEWATIRFKSHQKVKYRNEQRCNIKIIKASKCKLV